MPRVPPRRASSSYRRAICSGVYGDLLCWPSRNVVSVIQMLGAGSRGTAALSNRVSGGRTYGKVCLKYSGPLVDGSSAAGSNQLFVMNTSIDNLQSYCQC